MQPRQGRSRCASAAQWQADTAAPTDATGDTPGGRSWRRKSTAPGYYDANLHATVPACRRSASAASSYEYSTEAPGPHQHPITSLQSQLITYVPRQNPTQRMLNHCPRTGQMIQPPSTPLDQQQTLQSQHIRNHKLNRRLQHHTRHHICHTPCHNPPHLLLSAPLVRRYPPLALRFELDG